MNFFLTACLAITLLLQTTPAKSDEILPGEKNRFETSYESWIQQMVESLIQGNPVSVIANITYAADQKKSEIAETTEHLPGLPAVFEQKSNHPTDNPLYELMKTRKIKIIFDLPITQSQRELLNEVLSTKLELKTVNGDQIKIEIPNLATPKENALSDYFLLFAGLFALALLLGLIGNQMLLQEHNPQVSWQAPIEQPLKIANSNIPEKETVEPHFMMFEKFEQIQSQKKQEQLALKITSMSILDAKKTLERMPKVERKNVIRAMIKNGAINDNKNA